MFVYVEELTHYFWRIYDETIVKYKVVDILNNAVPNLSIEDLKRCGLNDIESYKMLCYYFNRRFKI